MEAAGDRRLHSTEAGKDVRETPSLDEAIEVAEDKGAALAVRTEGVEAGLGGHQKKRRCPGDIASLTLIADRTGAAAPSICTIF
jgi:hypothetical protein